MIVELIHNPASGTFDEFRLDVLSRAFEACGAQVRLGRTEIDGQFEIFPECDLVCVSGGDGALRLVVASMVRSGISKPLCVFPAGTVNLVARELGYSDDPEIFAREIMTGYLDSQFARLEAPLIAADGQPFVACISAGPDGQAVARHSPALKKRIGGAAYAWSLLKLFGDWPELRFCLTAETPDGSETKLTGAAFYVIKAHHYAGDWTLAPSAELAADRFHVIALSRARRRDFLRFLLAIALGRDPAQLAFVQSLPARRLSITAADQPSRQAAFQVDGDLLLTQPGEIRMVEQTVTYCLPLPA
ncbi:diacylglycerol/lipid kinase family protein [Sphingorhabdus sp. SMR4y]|uniref:diacylglycerol/lipid kinase family protein n=1 Tax=Sphingorhabdus sp. SMR4y TaxID=2584094 RepID=UPI000B5C74F7|nr:diacylglycerol kinase family protein [Sphingorhabdus sp. SMR4y]ASK89056.1 diacylglycerol kinase [Sphingorhabdus sp. SMR4y]